MIGARTRYARLADLQRFPEAQRRSYPLRSVRKCLR